MWSAHARPTIPRFLDTSLPQPVTPVHALLLGASVLMALPRHARHMARAELLRLREQALDMRAKTDRLRAKIAATDDVTRQPRNLAWLTRIAAAPNRRIARPVTAVGKCRAVARRQDTADANRQALHNLGGAAARLQSVATRPRPSSRPGSRPFRPVGAGELVIASVTKATPLAKDAGIDSTLPMDPAARVVRVGADAVRLQQVVDTLTRVALEASTPFSRGPPPVTSVIVNVARDASSVGMRVTGADGPHEPSRTDPTADWGTAPRDEGSAIAPGAAICGEMVKEHGGRLPIGTSGDPNACFGMRLPSHVDPNAAARG